jgi:hypothetical protein
LQTLFENRGNPASFFKSATTLTPEFQHKSAMPHRAIGLEVARAGPMQR